MTVNRGQQPIDFFAPASSGRAGNRFAKLDALPMPSATVTPTAIKSTLDVPADLPLLSSANAAPKTITGLSAPTGVDGVSKTVGSSGKVLFSNLPAPNPTSSTGNSPSSTLPAPQAKPATPAATSLPMPGGGMTPSIDGTASKVGGSTPQERYANQQQQLTNERQLASEPHQTNADRLAMAQQLQASEAAPQLQAMQPVTGMASALANKYAHLQNESILQANTANAQQRQESAKIAQQGQQFNDTMANKKQQDLQDNYARLLDVQQKAPYYASEAALNNAQISVANAKAQPKPEQYDYVEGKDGTKQRVSKTTGLMSRIPVDPMQKLQDSYDERLKHINDNYEPDTPEYAQSMDQLNNHPETKKLKQFAG